MLICLLAISSFQKSIGRSISMAFFALIFFTLKEQLMVHLHERLHAYLFACHFTILEQHLEVHLHVKRVIFCLTFNQFGTAFYGPFTWPILRLFFACHFINWEEHLKVHLHIWFCGHILLYFSFPWNISKFNLHAKSFGPAWLFKLGECSKFHLHDQFYTRFMLEFSLFRKSALEVHLDERFCNHFAWLLIILKQHFKIHLYDWVFMHFYSTFHQAGREFGGLFTLPISGYYFSLASYHFGRGFGRQFTWKISGLCFVWLFSPVIM